MSAERVRGQEIIEWRHSGTPQDEMDDVEVTYEEPGNANGFHVRWSG